MFLSNTRPRVLVGLFLLVISLSARPTKSAFAPISTEGRIFRNAETEAAAQAILNALDEALQMVTQNSDLSQARQLSGPATTFLGTLGTALGPIIGAIIGPLLTNIGQNLSAGTGGAPIIISSTETTSTTNGGFPQQQFNHPQQFGPPDQFGQFGPQSGHFGPQFGNQNQPINTAPMVTRPRPPNNRPTLSQAFLAAAGASLQHNLFGHGGLFGQGGFLGPAENNIRPPPMGGEGFGNFNDFFTANGFGPNNGPAPNGNLGPNGPFSGNGFGGNIEAASNFNNAGGNFAASGSLEANIGVNGPPPPSGFNSGPPGANDMVGNGIRGNNGGNFGNSVGNMDSNGGNGVSYPLDNNVTGTNLVLGGNINTPTTAVEVPGQKPFVVVSSCNKTDSGIPLKETQLKNSSIAPNYSTEMPDIVNNCTETSDAGSIALYNTTAKPQNYNDSIEVQLNENSPNYTEKPQNTENHYSESQLGANSTDLNATTEMSGISGNYTDPPVSSAQGPLLNAEAPANTNGNQNNGGYSQPNGYGTSPNNYGSQPNSYVTPPMPNNYGPQSTPNNYGSTSTPPNYTNKPNYGPPSTPNNYGSPLTPNNYGSAPAAPNYTNKPNSYAPQSTPNNYGPPPTPNNYGSTPTAPSYANKPNNYVPQSTPNNYGPPPTPNNYGSTPSPPNYVNKPANYGPQPTPPNYPNKPTNYGPQPAHTNYNKPNNYGPPPTTPNYVNKPNNYGSQTTSNNYGGNKPSNYGPQPGPSNYNKPNNYAPAQPTPSDYVSKPNHGVQPSPPNYANKPNNYGPQPTTANYGNKPNSYGSTTYAPSTSNYGNTRPNNYGNQGPPTTPNNYGGAANGNQGVPTTPSNYGSGPSNYIQSTGGAAAASQYASGSTPASQNTSPHVYPGGPAPVPEVPERPLLPTYHSLLDDEQVDDEIVAIGPYRKNKRKIELPAVARSGESEVQPVKPLTASMRSDALNADANT